MILVKDLSETGRCPICGNAMNPTETIYWQRKILS